MSIGILAQHRSGHTAYEQHLSRKYNLKILKEIDLNVKNIDSISLKNEKDYVISLMPRKDCLSWMQAQECDWQILLRRDLKKQCLSFIYTNKVQIFRDHCVDRAIIDIELIDNFFENYKIIQNIKKLNLYPIVYHEDIGCLDSSLKTTNNDYQSLIINYQECSKLIDNYMSNLSAQFLLATKW